MRVALILARKQGKAVDAAALFAWHGDLFVRKLPAVRNAREQRHAAFVAIKQVNVALLGQGLERGEDFALQGVDIRVRRILYLSSNAFVTATVFFRNRRSVSWENSLPNSC